MPESLEPFREAEDAGMSITNLSSNIPSSIQSWIFQVRTDPGASLAADIILQSSSEKSPPLR